MIKILESHRFPPLFQRLDELDRFSKLFSTFVRSYQNVLVDNIETFQSVSRVEELLISFHLQKLIKYFITFCGDTQQNEG